MTQRTKTILRSNLATIEEVEKVQIDFLWLFNILLVSVTGSESMASIMPRVSTRGKKKKKLKNEDERDREVQSRTSTEVSGRQRTYHDPSIIPPSNYKHFFFFWNSAT